MARKRRPNQRTLKNWAQGFSLLSDETRLGILRELAKGPKNVTELCKALKVKQPVASHHLGRLRMGRIVNGVREGKSVVYTTDPKALVELADGLGRVSPQ